MKMECVSGTHLHATQQCAQTTSVLDAAITAIKTSTVPNSIDVCDAALDATELLEFSFVRDGQYNAVVNDPGYDERHFVLRLESKLAADANAVGRVRATSFDEVTGTVRVQVSPASARRSARAAQDSAADIARNLDILINNPDFEFLYKGKILVTDPAAVRMAQTVAVEVKSESSSANSTTVAILVVFLLVLIVGVIVFVIWKQRAKQPQSQMIVHRNIIEYDERTRSPDVKYVQRVYSKESLNTSHAIIDNENSGLYDDAPVNVDERGTFRRDEEMAENLRDLSMHQPEALGEAAGASNVSATSLLPTQTTFVLKDASKYGARSGDEAADYTVKQVALTAGDPFQVPTAVATTFLEYFWTTQKSSGRITDEFDGVEHSTDTASTVLLASQPQNVGKNRDPLHGAFDATRVTLLGGAAADYINANFIDGYNSNAEFIATQAPNRATVTDFWRMVWDNHVTTIASTGEDGDVYCPEEGESINVGDINVLCTYCTPMYGLDNVVRKEMSIESLATGEERSVVQIQIKSWPRMQCPGSLADFSGFFTGYRDTHQRMGGTGPILMQGFHGAGRVGTAILFDISVHSLLDTGLMNLPQCLLQLRTQRARMVETPEQYAYVYEALVDLLVTRQTSSGSLSATDEQILQAHTDYRMKLADAENKHRMSVEVGGNDAAAAIAVAAVAEFDAGVDTVDTADTAVYGATTTPRAAEPTNEVVMQEHFVMAFANYIPANDPSSADDLPFAMGQVLQVHDKVDEDGKDLSRAIFFASCACASGTRGRSTVEP